MSWWPRCNPSPPPSRDQTRGFLLLTLTEEADPDFPFLGVHFSTEGGLGTGKGYVSMEFMETYEDMEDMPGSLRTGLHDLGLLPCVHWLHPP